MERPAREREIVRKVMEGSVKANTLSRIKSGMGKWIDFTRQFHDDDLYMERMNEEDQEWRILLFLGWLRESGLRGEQVNMALSRVRSAFSIAAQSVKAFDSEQVARGKVGCRQTTEEARISVPKLKVGEKLPFNLDLILSGRELFWKEGVWSVKELDRKAIWLCMAICFDSGLRVSNLTKAEKGNEDHCIRAEQLSFTFEDSQGKRTLVLGDNDVWKARADCLLTGLRPSMIEQDHWWIESVSMMYTSNKTSGRSGASVLDPKKIGRRSSVESNLLDDMIAWITHSGVLGSDPFFTRRANGSRTRFLRRKDLDDGIKEVCRANGLDESRFSTKSLRSGFSTACSAAGMTDKERNSRAGWATDSTVADRNYTFRNDNSGLFALHTVSSSGGGFNTEELRLLAPGGSDGKC